MNITERTLKTQRTARFYIAGTPSDKTNQILIVLHGYGQLAGDFIKQFDEFISDDTLIIAPEALSRFYRAASGNIIGASWMTKEDRQNEIIDYIVYLDSVLKEVWKETLKQKNGNEIKISILGFSQGVHTAVRWFTNSSYHFDKLFLCSNDFPKDADFETLKTKSESAKLFYIYGNSDNVISQNVYENSVQLLLKNEIKFEKIIFNGKHTINQDILIKAFGVTKYPQ